MRSLLLIAALCLQAPATTPARTGTLVIAGDVSKPATLTPADLRALPRTTVKIQEEGRTVSYEGVLLGELLKRAGAPLGSDLRGNALTSYVIASANDGYQVVFSLAELDPAFTSNDIIVADTVDGKPLFDYQGPLRIVAPKDTRAARSVRMLERLEVVRLRKQPPAAAYNWRLPAGFPPPPIPADNPVTEARVDLGRHLFYDTRLSGNHTQSCASCHAQARAFTDGLARSVGSTGDEHPRGSMSLVNVAYAKVLTWANPRMTRLEDQALVPMYGNQPIELGLSQSDAWIADLKQDAKYQALFPAAFPAVRDSFTRDNAVKAIATFERALVSARSPFDRYHFDRDDAAISAAAKRGEVLFHSRPLSCFTCHGGANFSSGMTDGAAFKAPTLRNIAVTAPYMHDGAVATLEEAVEHTSKTPGREGFSLTPDERADLIAFLQSLTDEELLKDPRFADPWPTGDRAARARTPAR